MKSFKIVIGILLLIIGVAVIKMLYFRMSLPYYDGRFFDLKNGVVYKQQSVAIYKIMVGAWAMVSLFVLYKFFKKPKQK